MKAKRGEDMVLPIEAALAPRGRGVPRLHRRPLWRAAGILQDLPEWTGTAGALVFLSATIFYALAVGGYARTVSESLTSAAGFEIEAVKLSGQRETTEFEILEALEIEQGTSLALFDASAARERLARIPWIETVSVQKLYPGTLQVRIDEREAFALWQRGNSLSVIDAKGQVISDDVDGRYANLLMLVGHGAQYRGAEILTALEKVPELRARVRAARLVSDRRWDLLLENGLTVRLPETDVGRALSDLVRMDADNGLLTRDITVVDIRLPDRVVVRMSDEAIERRNAETKSRGAKRSGGNA
ncbi:cell division protein FtsQ/DivIB [Stappia indica]|uniref:Cell division protein FtsQ n=2 Tax=Stappia indica TaxID=538381 RepID=A0A285R601_9HYPH|nr:cell division protein FtsQ/DivIB [Stappia indica]MCC4243085.1 cell division protein FtsQ/DivIB [Stappia indica]SOB89304.1 cell division protein FtsQ [Stappia indica]